MVYLKTLSEILERIIRINYRSIKQFAEENNIPYMTVSSVLNRGVENTTLSTLTKICNALDMSVSSLYTYQAYDTIFYKIKALPISQYTDEDLFNDLYESHILFGKRNSYTEERKKSIAQTFRNTVSPDDWLGTAIPPET